MIGNTEYEKFDVITLGDDNKDYALVEIFTMDGNNYMLGVNTNANGDLNYDNMVLLKKNNDNYVRVVDQDELVKAQNFLSEKLN